MGSIKQSEDMDR